MEVNRGGGWSAELLEGEVAGSLAGKVRAEEPQEPVLHPRAPQEVEPPAGAQAGEQLEGPDHLLP